MLTKKHTRFTKPQCRENLILNSDAYSTVIQGELDNYEDNYDTETGVRKFIEFLQSGKIEIRAYPSQNIHATVYISKFSERHINYSRFITGSSNFF